MLLVISNKMENAKKTYNTPDIQIIILDNEISLALESSTPPVGPSEISGINYINAQNPFDAKLS